MTTTTSTAPLPLRATPVRHVGRTVAAVVVGVAAAGVLWSLGKNPNLDWPTIGDYLLAELTLRGVVVTVVLTVVSMAIGLVGGVAVAVMRLSDNYVLRWVALAYVWFFRGTPVLVQIIFWGYLGAFYPKTSIGIPFTSVTFWSTDTSSLVTATTAAVLALGLNEIAYAAEIVRGGITSVPPGQREAAASLGLSPSATMRKVVLPQAMRVIVPPMGNEVITMLKTTALVSVISGKDLLTNLQQAYSQNFRVIPLLVVASLWYLAMVTVLSLVQSRLERRFGRGAAVRSPRTLRTVATDGR